MDTKCVIIEANDIYYDIDCNVHYQAFWRVLLKKTHNIDIWEVKDFRLVAGRYGNFCALVEIGDIAFDDEGKKLVKLNEDGDIVMINPYSLWKQHHMPRIVPSKKASIQMNIISVLKRLQKRSNLERRVVKCVKTSKRTGKRYFFTTRNEYGTFGETGLKICTDTSPYLLTTTECDAYQCELEAGDVIYVRGEEPMRWCKSGSTYYDRDIQNIGGNVVMFLDQFMTLIRFGPNHSKFKGKSADLIIEMFDFNCEPTVLSTLVAACFKNSEDQKFLQFMKVFMWWIIM